MANTHWQCKDCLNKACLAILTHTITEKYFYMAGQKSRKLYYCPIQQMAKLQLNPVKAQSTSWNAVFIHLQFQNTGFFLIHYTIQTSKYKSTPIRRCCPISFGNSRACANAASNQNPQHWPTVDRPIRELHKENMRSTGPLFSIAPSVFSFRPHDLHRNAQQRLLELQHSVRKSKN